MGISPCGTYTLVPGCKTNHGNFVSSPLEIFEFSTKAFTDPLEAVIAIGTENTKRFTSPTQVMRVSAPAKGSEGKLEIYFMAVERHEHARHLRVILETQGSRIPFYLGAIRQPQRRAQIPVVLLYHLLTACVNGLVGVLLIAFYHFVGHAVEWRRRLSAIQADACGRPLVSTLHPRDTPEPYLCMPSRPQ